MDFGGHSGTMDDYGKSSLGFDENVVALASYFGFLGLIIFFKEKTSNFVRFHAMQSTLGFGLLLLLWIAVKFVSFLAFLSWAPGLLSLIFATYMMIKAYYGEEFRMPIIGNLAFEAIYDTKEDFLATEEEQSNTDGQTTENAKG